MQELAETLRERSHKVFVATSYPGHNLAEGTQECRFKAVTDESGIQVLRIRTMPAHMVGYLLRGISQLVLPYVFFFRIKQLIQEKIDVVIVYSPPLPLAIAGKKVKDFFGARYILNIQDLFPQNAIDLGILKNRALIKFFENMEADAYAAADDLVVHSESNRRFLLERKRVELGKVNVIHNWIDTEPFRRATRTGRFRKLYGIEDSFVILFAGVLGPSQGLELIIDIASRLTNFPGICFLLVGDGMEKEKLMQMAANAGATNVVFKPFVSKEDYPELVKDADIGLVCLSCSNKTPVVPGKILGYMAASIPVAAFLNRESDGHDVIRDAQCGFSSVSDDAASAAEIIVKMYNDKELGRYGKNGFRYVNNNLDKEICIRNLESLFQGK